MDIQKINSITKYPSILTYHEIGERGRLKGTLTQAKSFPSDEILYCYEKVDGENSRMIFINDGEEADYFIGSREELLTSKGDRIANPYGNIAEFLKPLAEKLKGSIFKNRNDLALTVIYQESYGGKTPKSKNYTQNKTQGYQVFDVFSLTWEQFNGLMNRDVSAIASWRDNGGQPFYNETEKRRLVDGFKLDASPIVDHLSSDLFPESIDDVYTYLKRYGFTKVGIDVIGKSEGIIVRTENRSMIRKVRFEDYERTLRAR
ncbi:RNA ligase family protein [Paenibacillus polymyxa]|uniref:RNA ligase domain-containing protein n=1 Tax=Paenibacillus polymyxa (strain SC2) TaxID=886882 RepID=E3EII5_PAEPS|nr:RNA ligase family protein [Paenibacillus polymyxa]ADO55623.1 hypothetical protein PPSC2_07825 [Paenibacillus polymyxa SC2]WPQ58383.1 RNA ligase family protein [Paenibacillus polymyxa]CCC84423.1 hypothetical protein PPM_1486 [Paenibacillus polymyxa M1]